MAAVQMMCARLGMVSGRGLASAVRLRYPRWVLWGCCTLLTVANVINIGADLAGMADATRMVIGGPPLLWAPLFAAAILSVLMWCRYCALAKVFKWTTLALFAYVIAAFLAKPAWGEVLRATVLPQMHWSRESISMLVAILGTTISPYLFFWQAASEVEEEVSQGRTTTAQRKGASNQELRRSRNDVLIGMFFSNLVMYFIILTTASTLHAHGITHIETAQQAAGALKPLAGAGASWLFTIGLIGTGMLGVPVLAGSSAYAISEAMAWRRSLDSHPTWAREFYTVLGAAMALGLALNFLKFNAVKMLFWSAVANGLLAPPLIVVVVLLTSDKKVMGTRVNPPVLRWLGWTTAAVMSLAVVAMLVAG